MGIDKRRPAGKQPPGHPGHHRRYNPHRQLVMRRPIPENLNSLLVLPYRRQHPPERRCNNQPRQQRRRRQKHQTQRQKLPLALNHPPANHRPRNLVNAESPSGNRPPVQKDIECNDGKAEGHQHKHIVPKAVENHADYHRHRPGQQRAQRQRGKKRPGKGRNSLAPQLLVGRIGSQNRHRIGANAEKTDMPHRQQPRIAHHQIETHRQNRPDGKHRGNGHGEPHALPQHKTRRPANDQQVGPEADVAPPPPRQLPRTA